MAVVGGLMGLLKLWMLVEEYMAKDMVNCLAWKVKKKGICINRKTLLLNYE